MRKKTIVFIITTCLILALFSSDVMAEAYRGYTYNTWGETTAAPNGYHVEKVIYGEDLGIGALIKPSDLFVAHDGNLYILDSGNLRIIAVDKDFNVVKVIDKFTRGDREENLKDPSGMYIDANGRIYIADKGNGRVVVCDETGNVLRTVGSPKSDLIEKGFTYLPTKIVVDNRNMIYVLAENVFQGLLMFDETGSFKGFFGTNRVEVTPAILAERFRKQFLTREQKEATIQFTPIEYSNVFMDDQGFIYACVKKTVNSTGELKKINAKGLNVLEKSQDVSFNGNYGDLEWNVYRSKKIDTMFVDIAVDNRGYINGLDVERGRIFQYDKASNLLFIFGMKGEQKGTFKIPVAIECFQDRIVVLDNEKASITVFKTTPFGDKVREAVDLYDAGHYLESMKPWQEVLQMNTNSLLAYKGLGKAYLMLEQYDKAMEYFRLAYDRNAYSEALREYRINFARENFPAVASVVLIVLLAIVLLVYRKKLYVAYCRYILHKRVSIEDNNKTPFYPLHVVLHPFGGFEDMKFERKYSMWFANITLLLFCVFSIVRTLEMGFAFNYTRIESFNLLHQLASTLGIFVLWVIVNANICNLMDSKGKTSEVWMVSAYALLPIAFVTLPVTFISHFITIPEIAFLDIADTVAKGWSAVMLLMGLKAVHQYTLKKTIGTILLSLFGMALAVLLMVMVYSLFRQLYMFVNTVFNEIMFRL